MHNSFEGLSLEFCFEGGGSVLIQNVTIWRTTINIFIGIEASNHINLKNVMKYQELILYILQDWGLCSQGFCSYM